MVNQYGYSIFDLLIWQQDMNWPIALEILKPELERIRDYPTSDEIQSDLIEVIEVVLKRLL